MSGLPWADLLRLGVGDLRLAPDVFWNLTPAELMLLAGMDTDPSGAQNRAGLDRLMGLYPDETDNPD